MIERDLTDEERSLIALEEDLGIEWTHTDDDEDEYDQGIHPPGAKP